METFSCDSNQINKNDFHFSTVKIRERKLEVNGGVSELIKQKRIEKIPKYILAKFNLIPKLKLRKKKEFIPHSLFLNLTYTKEISF